MKISEDICMKFPAILREKLESGEVELPDDTKIEYGPIWAYRGIDRERDDITPVTEKDFQSYASLKRRLKRGMKKTANYYGVSLYQTKTAVENALKFPRPSKKIAKGYVVQEGGPQQTNKETQHICWWLYEDFNISGFVIIEKSDGNE